MLEMLLVGAVTMVVEDGLEPGDKAQNIFLACQAKANSSHAREKGMRKRSERTADEESNCKCAATLERCVTVSQAVAVA